MIFSDLFCYPCSTASYCSIFSVHFTHHFALQTKFGVVPGKLTIRYSGVDGHPNDDHSESVPGCWHGTFFQDNSSTKVCEQFLYVLGKF